MQKNQTTIMHDAKVEGVNAYNGKSNFAVFHPAKENSGLVFIVNGEKIPAVLESAEHKGKAIWLIGTKKRAGLVEHLLSAVYVLGIDNLEIELSDGISPTTNNCAFEYFKELKDIRTSNDAPKKFWTYAHKLPLTITAKDIFSIPKNKQDAIKVNKTEENFIVNCEAFYPHKVVGRQKYSFVFEKNDFEFDVAPARPPGFLKNEFVKDIFLGLGKMGMHGLNYENYLFITTKQARKYANPQHLGVRFGGGEFVRHKINDLLGTLALTGRQFANTEFSFYMTGHEFDLKTTRKLFHEGCFISYM